MDSKRKSKFDIIDAALKSGVIDVKAPIGELVKKFENPIDQVAGYVAAWDKYVLVVALADLEEEVTIIKRQR
jgi:hypothetical protein